MGKKQKFLIYRNPGNGNVTYKRYEVPVEKGMDILDALFYIQDHLDSTLAFRYACRGAVCGSCGMTINKVPLLACKTQISSVNELKKPIDKFIKSKNINFVYGDVPSWDEENEILIEPAPNMRVIKDLVVDLEKFWEHFRKIQPYFTREWNYEQPESKQTPEEMERIERYVYCILCGLCWACPVNNKNPNYLGPAQLAKASRFIYDSRIGKEQQQSIISRVMQQDGVPSCERYFICNQVCPKNVMPGTAINVELRKDWGKDE
ncbi:MAG: succinate dehydrogenase/fumarate reductase iron-sulfur subunit [Candidatus Lokiarchaeota archaeon]